MNYSFDSLKEEYTQKYAAMKVTRLSASKAAAAEIAKGKDRYLVVEKLTGVPWWFIGMLHLRESDCDFHTHLHNGDSLRARTRNVPAGRPKTGSPPFTFEFSAIDALECEGFTKQTDWSIERVAYDSEKYNGFGYRGHGVPSAYLWAGTNQYTRGKYVSDGVWNGNVVDTQLGCMAVLKCLLDGYVDSPPIAETTDENVVTEASQASIDRPTTKQMNIVSTKHWWTDWLQWLGFGGAAGGGALKAADASGIQPLQNAAMSAKQIGAIVGVSGIIVTLLAIAIYAMYMKKKMKDDVQEGRASPSLGEP